jgi:hypothetical protein
MTKSENEMIIKIKHIDILNLKRKCNLDIVCELYKIFDELSIECFSNCKKKQVLCYDQLCIYLDGINDNMCNVMLMKNLTCTIYESGLCNVVYKENLN